MLYVYSMCDSALNFRPVQPRTFCFVTTGIIVYTSTQLFQMPSVIMMVISATRIHRSLVDFASGSTDVYDLITPCLFSHTAVDIAIA
jgi:hypothetical protein